MSNHHRSATWRRVAEQASGTSTDGLEDILIKDPQNLAARLQLICRYLVQLSPRTRSYRNRHIHWLIQEHPKLDIEGYGVISPHFDPMAYAEGRRLWLEQVREHGQDADILWNAAQFLLGNDRTAVDELIDRGVALEPTAARWHEARGLSRRYAWVSESSEAKRVLIAGEIASAYRDALQFETLARRRYRHLADAGLASARAADYTNANAIAQELIASASEYDDATSRHGLYAAHIILGLCASAIGQVIPARTHLSSAVESSPYFAAGEVLGPDFTLAASLLAHGERESVLAYLDACERSWPHAEELESWRQMIARGEVPSFRLG